MLSLIILFSAAFLAGIQNAIAGGGSFLTLAALIFTGLDARAANITSTIALFPGQMTTSIAVRKGVAGLPGLSFRTLFVISLIGGFLGGILLLATPASIFEFMVPFLVLLATGLFAWGSFFRKSTDASHRTKPWVIALMQFAIAIYGGYFGGGIGILMLAALTLGGQTVKQAASTKNVLACVLNFSAVLIFLFSSDVVWKQALIAGVAAMAGGQVGAYVLHRINDRILRVFIILLGVVLTVALSIRSYGMPF